MQNTEEAPPQTVRLNAERITAGEIGLGDIAPSAVTDDIAALAVRSADLRVGEDYSLHLAHELGGAVPLQPGTLLNIWGLREDGGPSQRYVGEDRTMRTVLRDEDGTPYLPPVVLQRIADITAAREAKRDRRPEPVYALAERILLPAEPKPRLAPDMKYTVGDMQALRVKLAAEDAAAERESLEARLKQPTYVTPETDAEPASDRHRTPLRTRVAAGAVAVARSAFSRSQPVGRRHIRPNALRPVAPVQKTGHSHTPRHRRQGAPQQPAAAYANA